MDDDFSNNHLIQVSNEDTKNDSRLQIDIFSYPDLIEYDLFYILSIISVACITILAFHHYGISENVNYLNQNMNSNLIVIPPINNIPFSGFYRIYFRAVRSKKSSTKENLVIHMNTTRKYLNRRNITLNNQFTFYSSIQFIDESDVSSPVTLVSSHDTSNYSIGFVINTTFSKDINSAIISWEIGSRSTVIFSFFIKFFFFAISIIIFILVIWLLYYSDTYIWVKNFEISATIWISFIFYSFFCSYQNNSFLYFFFYFISTATFQILTKLAIIYYITSIRLDRTSNSKRFEDYFALFGYIFYSVAELISVFLISISIFSRDQLNSELKGMKLDFFISISFIIYIIAEFIQTRSLIEDQEKMNLIAFFSISLIYILERITVQYFLSIKNIYFCQQAGNNINYTSSALFIFLLLKYNWPIDDDVEIYYQPELVGEDLDLLQ